MPCPCKEIERQHGAGDCKCTHYREAFPNCECEQHSVSDHSPGTVQDDEVLIRTVYSRVQLNSETGCIDPVHLRHDARTRGLSLNRKSHITEGDLRARIEAKIARDRAAGKRTDNFYKVIATRLRDLKCLVDDDGRRLFCVYDTATRDDTSHADMCQSSEPAKGTANRNVLLMKLSSRLLEAFVTPAADVVALYVDEPPVG